MADCALHRVATDAVEAELPALLVDYRGTEACPPGEVCPGICDLARLYRRQSEVVRHMQSVPEKESPAVLWPRLSLLVRQNR